MALLCKAGEDQLNDGFHGDHGDDAQIAAKYLSVLKVGLEDFLNWRA